MECEFKCYAMVISSWSTSTTCHTIHAKFRRQLIRRQNSTDEIKTGLPQTQTEHIRDHQSHRHSGTANQIMTVAVIFQSYDLPLLISDSVPSLLAHTIYNTNGTYPWSSVTQTLRNSQQNHDGGCHLSKLWLTTINLWFGTFLVSTYHL